MHQHMVSWFGSICGRIEWNAFALRGFVCIYSSYRNWCHSFASVCIEILIKKFTFYFFQIAFDVCQLPLSLKCSHMHRTGKKSHFFCLHFKKFVDGLCSSNVLGSDRIKFHSTSSLHTFLLMFIFQFIGKVQRTSEIILLSIFAVLPTDHYFNDSTFSSGWPSFAETKTNS